MCVAVCVPFGKHICIIEQREMRARRTMHRMLIYTVCVWCFDVFVYLYTVNREIDCLYSGAGQISPNAHSIFVDGASISHRLSRITNASKQIVARLREHAVVYVSSAPLRLCTVALEHTTNIHIHIHSANIAQPAWSRMLHSTVCSIYITLYVLERT